VQADLVVRAAQEPPSQRGAFFRFVSCSPTKPLTRAVGRQWQVIFSENYVGYPINIMNLLPFEQFSFQTRFTPDQVRQHLSSKMEEREAMLSWTPLKSNPNKAGTVEEYKFETRPSTYRKRHRSIMKGKVSYELGTTKIDVTLMPPAYVLMGAVLIFAFFGFAWLLFLVEWIRSIGTSNPFFPTHVLGIGGALILAYLFFVIVVKIDAEEMKDLLRIVLHAIEK
jgi:hypothetical protein